MTLTVENPQAVTRTQIQPTMISVFPVKNLVGLVLTIPSLISYTLGSSSSFSEDIPISITPTKLIIIAQISKQEILSPSIHHARKDVQNGAVLNIVVCTTIGTIAIPNVIEVNAIVADADRQRIIAL